MVMDDAKALELYEASMDFNNLQPSTVKVRHRYLTKFSREVGFANATEQVIIQYLSRKMSAKTRGMYISTFHTFYKFALRGDEGKPIYPPDEKGVAFLPTENITKPKTHPRHPRPMPIDDIRKALSNANPLIRCWIACGAYEGMRCQEIAFLAVEDISEPAGTLEITHGKGDKQRYVPLHPEVLQVLKDLPMPESGRFWPKETADSISTKGNRFLKSLGISSTMHQLRHHFGTSVYQASGGDIVLTQGLLGHSSIATTQTYAAADVTKAVGVVSGLKI